MGCAGIRIGVKPKRKKRKKKKKAFCQRWDRKRERADSLLITIHYKLAALKSSLYLDKRAVPGADGPPPPQTGPKLLPTHLTGHFSMVSELTPYIALTVQPHLEGCTEGSDTTFRIRVRSWVGDASGQASRLSRQAGYPSQGTPKLADVTAHVP